MLCSAATAGYASALITTPPASQWTPIVLSFRTSPPRHAATPSGARKVVRVTGNMIASASTHDALAYMADTRDRSDTNAVVSAGKSTPTAAWGTIERRESTS